MSTDTHTEIEPHRGDWKSDEIIAKSLSAIRRGTSVTIRFTTGSARLWSEHEDEARTKIALYNVELCDSDGAIRGDLTCSPSHLRSTLAALPLLMGGGITEILTATGSRFSVGNVPPRA